MNFNEIQVILKRTPHLLVGVSLKFTVCIPELGMGQLEGRGQSGNILWGALAAPQPSTGSCQSTDHQLGSAGREECPGFIWCTSQGREGCPVYILQLCV